MISSGALPNVALSSPPIASPVRVASCSVEDTINPAAGTMASAAEKKRIGGGTCAYSSASEMGTKASSQFIDGLKETAISGVARRCRLPIQAVDDREEE